MFSRRAKIRSYEMDMCTGPLTRKILIFSFPLMLSSILQLLYNAADIVVVGRFTGPTALAAVGSTGAIINLTINIFIGLSVGASVAVAADYGAGKLKNVRETVHTAMTLSVIGGVVLGIFGVLMAKTFMQWMGSPHDVLDQATLYLQIYFAGLPATMIYNFAAAVLRAVGDTKRPLYYLSISGVVNVLLNLYFVIVFHMGVAGVGLATVISQCISAALIVICMLRSTGAVHLNPREMRIHRDKFAKIARVGLPAGLQGSIFSISNVLIQSSVNSFGSVVMAGNAASANLEGFIYASMNTFYQAALSFAGQNMGARKPDRVRRVLVVCTVLVTAVGLLLGGLAYLFRFPLLGVYSPDPAVVNSGIFRLEIICTTYFLCGIMDVLVGELRGMGYSIVPMLVSLLGVCGIRIAWLYTIFAWKPTLTVLYLSYPVSWTVTAAAHFVCFIFLYRKVKKHMTPALSGNPGE